MLSAGGCGGSSSGGGTVAVAGSTTERAVCTDVASKDLTGNNLVFAHGGALDSIGPDLDALARDKAAGAAMVADGGVLQLDLIGADENSIANLDADLGNLRADCQQQTG